VIEAKSDAIAARAEPSIVGENHATSSRVPSQIEVRFNGPYILELQERSLSVLGGMLPHVIDGSVGREESGVYLWTIEHDSAYLINYVGKTIRGFGARTREQVKWIRDNRDNIVDVDRFLKGERVVLYSKRSLPSYDIFRRDFLQPIERLLKAYRIFWAPVDAHLTKLVEAVLLKELRRGAYSHFLSNDVFPRVPRASVITTATATLLGIPDVIDFR
jgi:hypothetical protein